jgi:hypothetical protein
MLLPALTPARKLLVPNVAVIMSPLNVAAPVTVKVPADRVTTWSTASNTFVPSQYTSMVLPTGTAMPEPAAVLTVITWAVPFLTIYTLLSAGQITLPAPVSAVPESVKDSIAARDSAVVPLAVVSVWELVVHVFTTDSPAIACSTIEVILSFTTSPHVPLSSP